MRKFFFFILLLLASPAKSENQFYLIATINNVPVTNIDIVNEIEIIKILNKNLDGIKTLPTIALQNIVHEILKKEEIEKTNTKINEKVIARQVDEFIKRKDLKNIKITKKIRYGLNKKFKIDIAWNKLVANKYSSKININMAEIDEKLRNNPNIENKKNFAQFKEGLIKTEKNKKIMNYSNNHLAKIKRQALIKIFK